MNTIKEIRVRFFVEDQDFVLTRNERVESMTFAPTEDGEYVIQWIFDGAAITKVINKESVVDITIIHDKEEDKEDK